jgi:hypothetical protein
MRFASLQIVLATALLGALAGRAAAQVEREIPPVPTAPPAVVPFAATPPAEAPAVPPKPLFAAEDEKTLAAYQLDVPKLDRFEVVLRNLDLKAKTDEALKAELDQDEAKSAGIDRFVESIEKEKPKMMAILQAAGMTPREFVLTSYSVMMAMVYADLFRAQADATLPTYVARANLGFVKRHEDRLARLFDDLNHD